MYPGIQAFSVLAGFYGNRLMKLRLYPNHKFAGVWFLRLFTARCAKLKVIVNGASEGLVKFVDCFPLKRNNISQVDHFTVEYIGLIVKLNFCKISFIFHHGFTPASCRTRRTDLTVPLPVTRSGCGR